MKKLALLIALLWLALGTAPLQAQNALQLATCGAFPRTLQAGDPAWIGVDLNGNLCVSASVTASVTGFAPAGTFATLTATGSSASVALPAGAVVLFQNTGTTAVSCTLGVGSATATANENIIQPLSWAAYTVGANTFGACIDQTGSVSNVVVLSGGTGLATGAGGGAGGSGGAVTVASGADVAEGAIGDAAWVSGNGTVIALLKNLAASGTSTVTNTGAAVPAGTNTIGSVVNAPSSSSSLAMAGVSCGSAVSSCVLKNTAGNLYGVYAECTSACWLMVFNATSAPSNGSTTAGVAASNLVDCIDISAGSSKSLTYPTIPRSFSTGITAVISSTACATLTLSTVGFVSGTVQ